MAIISSGGGKNHWMDKTNVSVKASLTLTACFPHL